MHPLREAAQAACAPGSTTPITGTDRRSRRVSSATADAVLQAITTCLTPRPASSCAACTEYFRTVSGLLVPYGKRAVSPRYMKCSCGNAALRARSTVSPPTPESNTPIGFAAAAPFRRDTRLVDDTRCDLVLRTLELPGKGELSTRTLGDSLPRAYAYVAAPRAVDSRHNAYTAHFA